MTASAPAGATGGPGTGAPSGAGMGFGFCRVTIVAPDSRIDVALPDDVPVADLYPEILRLSQQSPTEGAPVGYHLVRRDGTVLDGARSFTAQRILDGELLTLRPFAESLPPAVVDDVSEAVAAAVTRDRTLWNGDLTRAAGLVAGGILPALLAFVAWSSQIRHDMHSLQGHHRGHLRRPARDHRLRTRACVRRPGLRGRAGTRRPAECRGGRFGAAVALRGRGHRTAPVPARLHRRSGRRRRADPGVARGRRPVRGVRLRLRHRSGHDVHRDPQRSEAHRDGRRLRPAVRRGAGLPARPVHAFRAAAHRLRTAQPLPRRLRQRRARRPGTRRRRAHRRPGPARPRTPRRPGRRLRPRRRGRVDRPRLLQQHVGPAAGPRDRRGDAHAGTPVPVHRAGRRHPWPRGWPRSSSSASGWP